MLVELPSDMNGSVKTPVASHLYNMDKDSVKLPEETAHLFHHLISNLLYFSHRTRQDIQTVVYSYGDYALFLAYNFKVLAHFFLDNIGNISYLRE